MASMLSARSKLQRADSIHRGRNVSGLGIVEKGSKSPAGKSSPSTMQPKSKIPTNVSQLPRSGASLVVTEEITKEEVFDMKSVSKNDDAKVQGYISCQSTPMVTPRLRAPAAGSVRRLAARSLSNSKPAIPKPKTSLNRLLENQFNAKKHKYTLLRKELTDKQKNVLDLYEEIVGMREKVIASGFSDPGKPEEISVVQTSRMTPKQPEPVPGEGSGEQSYDLTSSISNEFVSSLKDKLHELPNAGFALCREALRKRSDILLSWLAASGDENNAKVLDPATAKQIEIFQTDGLTLQERLEGAEKLQEQMTVELLQKISALWGEHESYRIHIKEQEVAGGALVKDLRGKLSNVVAELNAEQEKCSQFKERKICLDGQVQKAKLRIRELEAHVTNNDTKIRQLQENVKSLEAQQKQKDASHEQRTKDMQKSMKNSESLLSKMEKQRDCLESRLIDLKETIGSKELESESTVRTMTRKLEEVARSLEDEKKARQQAETELSEIRERFSKLEDKSQQLCDLAEKTKDLPVTDGSHTDEEVRLWQQLQEALSSVHERDEKLVQLQHEKDEIVTLMHQAAGQDIAGSVKGKLAAELIAKTEELQVLMADHLLLQKNNKILREKSDNVEKQLADLHSRLHAQCMEGGKAGWSAHAVELQQQVSDLQTGMAELARRNEELESTLTQKQLELEHRDRLMRDQSKVLKVRDELIDLMKGKDQRMNGNIATLQNDVDEENHDMDQVNKQISAKAEELQALYSTLESKQMQVMRLEKLVKQLEDQHDRAQAKRTRLESHIAELQIQLEERNQGYVAEQSLPLTNLSSVAHEDHSFHDLSEHSYQQTLLRPTVPPKLRHLHSRPSLPPSIPCQYSPRSKANNSSSIKKAGDCRIPQPSQASVDTVRGMGDDNPDSRRDYRHEGRRCTSPRAKHTRDTNSTSHEIRESFYDWLMEPSVLESTREFVRHSRALHNGELFRSSPSASGTVRRGWQDGMGIWSSDGGVGEGSRKFLSDVHRCQVEFRCRESRSPLPNKPSSAFKNAALIRVRRYTT